LILSAAGEGREDRPLPGGEKSREARSISFVGLSATGFKSAEFKI